MCVYRRDTNLQDILVHSTFSSHPEQEQAGTFPCQRPRCRTCTFTGRTANINHSNGVVHTKERHTCTTTSVIYAITCRRCQAMYIGETGRKLSDRFGEHLARWKDTTNTHGTRTVDSLWPNISVKGVTTPLVTCQCL